MLRHEDLRTFGKILLPPYSGSKKSSNNSSWISWTLNVFSETWIFINMSVRTRNSHAVILRLVWLNEYQYRKKPWYLRIIRWQKVFDCRVVGVTFLVGRACFSDFSSVRNFQTWTFALRSQLKIQVFFPPRFPSLLDIISSYTLHIYLAKIHYIRAQYPRGLRRGSAAARVLGWRVRIP